MRSVRLLSLGLMTVVLALPSTAAAGARTCPVLSTFHTRCRPQSPAQARSAAAMARSDWYHEISRRGRRGRTHPHPVHFRSPPATAFLARLRTASRRYDFHVVHVHIYRPLQLAPFVIARTAHPKRLSKAMKAIEQRLDPLNTLSALPTAWTYEGFYFEARDTKDVPAFLVFNYVRGGIVGGQWARSEALYPFPHG
jgi:hypothetical protein